MAGQREEYKAEWVWEAGHSEVCWKHLQSEDAVWGYTENDCPLVWALVKDKRTLYWLAALLLWSSALTPISDSGFLLLIPTRICVTGFYGFVWFSTVLPKYLITKNRFFLHYSTGRQQSFFSSLLSLRLSFMAGERECLALSQHHRVSHSCLWVQTQGISDDLFWHH